MTYLKLFLTFLKIGAFTFGGGYAMLPMIQDEVIRNSWMTMEDLIDFIAISEGTPGPFGVNISTYVGYEVGGFLGAFSSTLGVVLPSFIIILLVAKIYNAFRKSIFVKGAMNGLKPAVVALIATAVLSAVKQIFSIGNGINYLELLLGIIIFVLSMFALNKKIHPLIIIAISAVLGVVFKTLIL